jgi:hypothetical protein
VEEVEKNMDLSELELGVPGHKLKNTSGDISFLVQKQRIASEKTIRSL